MDGNRIPENGQMSEKKQNRTELPPEREEKVDGGTLFHPGRNRCLLCGQVFDNPVEYAAHIIDVHNRK